MHLKVPAPHRQSFSPTFSALDALHETKTLSSYNGIFQNQNYGVSFTELKSAKQWKL
jgi:hypothetical protein